MKGCLVDPVACVEGGLEHPDLLHPPLLPDVDRVDAVAEDAATESHHAAEGADHPHRVAVRLDDPRIGEDLQEGVEMLEVVWSLAEPTAGALPEQQLHHFRIFAIGRRVIDALEPGREARQPHERLERGAPEGDVEQKDVFFLCLGLDGVSGKEVWRHVFE